MELTAWFQAHWVSAVGAFVIFLAAFGAVLRQMMRPVAPLDGIRDRASDLWTPMSFEARDELVTAIAGRSSRKSTHYRFELEDGELVAVGHTPKDPWLDVYVRREESYVARAPQRGPYEVYGFSLNERRWSYGVVPVRAGHLTALIERGFPHA